MTQQRAVPDVPMNLLQFRGMRHHVREGVWARRLLRGAAWTAGSGLLLVTWRHPRLRWLVASGAVGALCAGLVHRARARDAEARVDEVLEDSFPASDPPSVPSVPQM